MLDYSMPLHLDSNFLKVFRFRTCTKIAARDIPASSRNKLKLINEISRAQSFHELDHVRRQMKLSSV